MSFKTGPWSPGSRRQQVTTLILLTMQTSFPIQPTNRITNLMKTVLVFTTHSVTECVLGVWASPTEKKRCSPSPPPGMVHIMDPDKAWIDKEISAPSKYNL